LRLALHGEERVLPLKEGKKEGNNIFGSTELSIQDGHESRRLRPQCVKGDTFLRNYGRMRFLNSEIGDRIQLVPLANIQKNFEELVI
jgi:hypothetical protein